MEQGGVEAVRFRNQFYRDGYRRVLFILLISFLLNAVLVSIIYYQIISRPTPTYFATNQDGTLKELIPLNQPHVSQEQLLSWASQAAIAAYSFNFLDYRSNLQNARKYFTPEGFDNFVKALDDSGNLQAVIQKRLVVKPVITDVPIIVKEGMIGGIRYGWRLQIPMLIQYVSASDKIEQPVLVTLLVVRVSTLDSSEGIAISSFVTEDRKLTYRNR
ncbi:MAG: type IVB secretion system apparatus protein IcmL/DotI [Gammaproteobacteria bacterium]